MDLLSDVMFWREALTVAAFGLFVGIALWAYSRSRKADFDDASTRVVQDDDTTGEHGDSK